MPRPVDADAMATRRRILDNALRLFSEHGAAGTSVRDIARASAVSLAMVHHYFGSKEALYGACIDSMYVELGELRSDLERALALGGAVRDLVEQATRIGFRFARSHQTALRLLLRDVIETGELDERRREGMQLPFLGRASELLGTLLGRPAHALRLPLQSVVAMTARYAVSSQRELELLSDVPRARAHAAVEDHLVFVAHSLLGLTTPPSKERIRASRNAN